MLEGKPLLLKEKLYLFPTTEINWADWHDLKKTLENDRMRPASKVTEKPTVLIVDDHAAIRATIRDILDPYCNFIEAGNAEAAIQECEDHVTIDAILLDIRMPGQQGNVLLPRLQELHPEAEIIVITAYRETEIAIEVLQKGAFTYLNKPFSPDELIATIMEALFNKYVKQIADELGERNLPEENSLMGRIHSLSQHYNEKREQGERIAVKEVASFFPELKSKNLASEEFLPDTLADGLLFWLANNFEYIED